MTDIIERLRWIFDEFESLSLACENEYGGSKQEYKDDKSKCRQAIDEAIAIIERNFDSGAAPNPAQMDPAGKAEAWLRACSTWLLENDLDMQMPDGVLDIDPLDIADELAAYRVQIEQSSRGREGVREAIIRAIWYRFGSIAKGGLDDPKLGQTADDILSVLAQPPLAPVGDVREVDDDEPAAWAIVAERAATEAYAQNMGDPDGNDDTHAARMDAARAIEAHALAALQSSTSAHVPAGYALVSIREWNDAFLAFQGAFNTPMARLQDDSEYAADARARMRELNGAISSISEEGKEILGIDEWEGEPADGPAEQRLRDQRKKKND